MRISVITYAAFWPMLINTIYGVRAIDPQALDVARNFGITGYEALWRVTLPSALASIATGLPRFGNDRARRDDHDRADRRQQRHRVLHLANGTSEPSAAHVRGHHPDGHPRLLSSTLCTSHSSTKSSSGRLRPGNGSLSMRRVLQSRQRRWASVSLSCCSPLWQSHRDRSSRPCTCRRCRRSS